METVREDCDFTKHGLCNLPTAYDDARAELRYQMEQSPGEVNIINLLGVLLAAQSARAK